MAEKARRNPARPRVFYVSYDGAGEPLGRSQVVSYLTRLAKDCDITLVSFEKSGDAADAVRAELDRARIEWRPLRYHGRPPVVSTLADVLTGVAVLTRLASRGRPDIVHVRSDVPALMALLAGRQIGGKLLFDIRGFWADERVEGGLWPEHGQLYRLTKRLEQRFYRRAAAIVTLTRASVPTIREWARTSAPVEVIPTCVDLERFCLRPARPDGPRAVWSGSIGTWYRFDLALPMARALGLPLRVITRQSEQAREQLGPNPGDVLSLAPDRVPQELHTGDVGLCLIKSSFSKRASAPTRFAEYLASGMPVVVTPEVGDLAELVECNRVGAVLRGEGKADLADAAERVSELRADGETPTRCRDLATRLFDVERGSQRYLDLYREILTRPEPSA